MQLGKRVVWPLLGKRATQPLFEAMYRLALAGQNYGMGAHPDFSGEAYLLENVRDNLGADVTLFDVGGNVGDYARAVRGVFGPQARLYTFEPSPTTFEKLQASIPPGTATQAFQVGFSDESTTAELYSAGPGSKMASLHDVSDRFERRGLGAPVRESVALTTLDEFTAEHGVERIDLLKMDIEGHELSALRGAERLLAEDRIGVIQFEIGGTNVFARTFVRDFFDVLGERFMLYRLLQDGLRDLGTYDETYEVFHRSTQLVAIHRSIAPRLARARTR
jgi:FkbM family methyltransferase